MQRPQSRCVLGVFEESEEPGVWEQSGGTP